MLATRAFSHKRILGNPRLKYRDGKTRGLGIG